ncbi:MAG: IS4 family transposase [Verrucomicrobiales bacterium]
MLAGTITNALRDRDFVDRHRTTSEAFTRERKLPFHRVCLILIWNLRAALQSDLERFFDRLGESGSAPHRTAFSKARSFLKPSAFIDLNDRVIQAAHDLGLRKNTWHRLRLLAVDGSTLRLAKGSKEIAEHFGGMDTRHDTFCPLARMSYLYEVRTGLILSAQLSPLAEGECTQAYELLGERVWEEDCVLYDRGYNDPRIIAWTLAQKSNFVIRVAAGKSKAAQDFIARGTKEHEFCYVFDDELVNEFERCGQALSKSCRLRYIRVELETGEMEVLVTNLTDSKTYPAEEFKELYHERWAVEEGIKTAKCKIEVENWTGKTVHSVEQDFQARVVCQNIAVFLSQASQATLDRIMAGHKHTYKINIKRALGLIRDQFVQMMTGTRKAFMEAAEKLASRLPQSASLVRPGRSFPRKSPRRIPAAQPYKPIE